MIWIIIPIIVISIIIIPTIEFFYYKRKFDIKKLSISKNYWKAMDKLNSSKTIEQFDNYKNVILTWLACEISRDEEMGCNWSTGQIILYNRIVGNKCVEYYNELSNYNFENMRTAILSV